MTVDLVVTAAHKAARAGAEQVMTSLEVPELSVIGFRPGEDGFFRLDTSFLAADSEQARRLVQQAQTVPHRWANYRSRHHYRVWIG